MTLPDSGCINRVAYFTPYPNVNRGIFIGVGNAATRKTLENTLALSVLFGAMSTGIAGAGRVARVNERHGNARLLRLVSDKSTELEESPVSEVPSHLSTEAVASVTDTLKVFHGECLPRGKRVLNKLLADVVVQPLLVVGRVSAHAFQVTLGVLRPLALQERTDTPCTSANGFDGLARIGAPFAIRRKADDAQVNAQNAVRLNQGRVGQVTRRQKVEFPP